MRKLIPFLAAMSITLAGCPEPPEPIVPQITINEGDVYVDVNLGDDDSASETPTSDDDDSSASDDDDSTEEESCEFELVLPEELGEYPHCNGALQQPDAIEIGDLIQPVSLDAIYYYAEFGYRHIFPTEATFVSWYGEEACPLCENVKELPDVDIAAIQMGTNVTIKPGSRIVVIGNDPTLYVVDVCKTLRPVTPAVASEIYGSSWNTLITIVPDFFFADYQIGDYVPTAADFDLVTAENRTLPEELTCIAETTEESGILVWTSTGTPGGNDVPQANMNVLDFVMMAGPGDSEAISDLTFEITTTDAAGSGWNTAGNFMSSNQPFIFVDGNSITYSFDVVTVGGGNAITDPTGVIRWLHVIFYGEVLAPNESMTYEVYMDTSGVTTANAANDDVVRVDLIAVNGSDTIPYLPAQGLTIMF